MLIFCVCAVDYLCEYTNTIINTYIPISYLFCLSSISVSEASVLWPPDVKGRRWERLKAGGEGAVG